MKHINKLLAKFRFHQDQKTTDSMGVAREIRQVVAKNLNDPSLNLDKRFKRKLTLLLEYDTYQAGDNWKDLSKRPPFTKMLFTHPYWLLNKNVLKRVLFKK